MSLSRAALIGILVCNTAMGAEGFMIGGGAEADAEDGVALALLGGVGLGEKTWLSAGVGESRVDLASGRRVESLYADIELDHHFDPLGIRIGAAYWGDPDVLESRDWRASLYWRNDSATVSFDYEFRDFDFTIPSLDATTERVVMFDADGFGASLRLKTSENTNLRLRGIQYDYSVPFRIADNADAVRLITVSRLSLINSLVDHRAGVAFSLDRGLQKFEIDVSTWEGVIDRSRTRSLTFRLTTPMGGTSDVEFGIGFDDSELYGNATFFSLYMYFYGGG